jgi:hypothetical protein
MSHSRVSGQTIESVVPARLDRLPWSAWHVRISNSGSRAAGFRSVSLRLGRSTTAGNNEVYLKPVHAYCCPVRGLFGDFHIR